MTSSFRLLLLSHLHCSSHFDMLTQIIWHSIIDKCIQFADPSFPILKYASFSLCDTHSESSTKLAQHLYLSAWSQHYLFNLTVHLSNTLPIINQSLYFLTIKNAYTHSSTLTSSPTWTQTLLAPIILFACVVNTVEPLYNGQFGSRTFVLYMEVVVFQRLQLVCP